MSACGQLFTPETDPGSGSMWCPNPLLLAGEQLGSSPQDRASLQPLGLQVGPGELCGPQKAVGREHGRAGLESASVALKEPVWLRGALVLAAV